MKIVIFASGTGSNFEAIADNKDLKENGLEIKALVTDNPSAPCINKACIRSIPVIAVNPKEYKTREDFEHKILSEIEPLNPDYLILAGYMKIISNTLLDKYKLRIVNIHPALLPSFPGINGIRDAFHAKVNKTGVTIHFIDGGVDTGPIIEQKEIPIFEHDTLETLEQRIHEEEHLLYPHVINQLINQKKEW